MSPHENFIFIHTMVMKKTLTGHKAKPLKQAQGRQAGIRLPPGTAQFMVLLNGLILTITVFFVLTYFIHEMSREEYRKSARDAGKYLVESISSIENSMQFVSGLIRLSGVSNKEILTQQIRRNVPGLSQFDQLVWVFETRPGAWQYKTVFQRAKEDLSPSAYSFRPDQEFISRLVNEKFFENETLHLLTDFSGMNYVQEIETPRVMGRPVALTQVIEEEIPKKEF